jgi:hypothetical protein
LEETTKLVLDASKASEYMVQRSKKPIPVPQPPQ